MVSIIVAYSKNRVIGNENDIPWYIREDMQFFKKRTTGKIVIMGRKTYESIPEKHRPFPNRETYILTRDKSYRVDHPDVTVFNEFKKALMVAKLKAGDTEIRNYLQQLPETLDLEIEGKRLLVVHANPPSEQHGGIKLRNRDGELIAERKQAWSERLADLDYDVLIVGHTHQVYAEQLGKLLVINPGSVPFNHSCMILSLPDLVVSSFALGGEEIIYCWNFSMLAR